ncbi:cathepsin E-like, partial [Notothenia coriiceps]|uniref:Cathepsin E-like n=1 Tax=Notothenia coriiceps TaxID=8208 RepID=A0A6I9N7N4_9TELE
MPWPNKARAEPARGRRTNGTIASTPRLPGAPKAGATRCQWKSGGALDDDRAPQNICYPCRKESGDAEGELLLGGTDKALYTGLINWLPVTAKGYWQIKMNSVVVQGVNPFCPNGCQAIVDTGTSLITGPTDDILSIQQLIGATPTNIGEFIVDCARLSSFPHVTFVLGGKQYTLTSEQYIRKFIVDCARLSSFPHVTFVLGGKQYTLTSEQYIRK